VIPAAQRPVAALLRRLTGAAPIETRTAAVFVGPDAAFKLKKAVDLGFLDFTAPADRERFARRELALNARFAPGLYRDVVPVTRAPDGEPRLGGGGEATDWVLCMAPVPAADFLDAVAARGGLTPDLLDEAADAVAAMHASLAPSEAWTRHWRRRWKATAARRWRPGCRRAGSRPGRPRCGRRWTSAPRPWRRAPPRGACAAATATCT
jgi:aminoglycoside phosphotransferase family enzyme